jgi:hypothetical protein
VLHPREVGGLVGAELVCSEEVLDLVFALDVQPMPVDDRVAPEDEADGFEVGERELVESLEPVGCVELAFAQEGACPPLGGRRAKPDAD